MGYVQKKIFSKTTSDKHVIMPHVRIKSNLFENGIQPSNCNLVCISLARDVSSSRADGLFIRLQFVSRGTSARLLEIDARLFFFAFLDSDYLRLRIRIIFT